MAKKRKTAIAIAVANGKRNAPDLEQLAAENKLTEADVAILHEVALNRKAIVKLGAIALDHERRIGNLEEALADLAGEEEAPIDLKAEKEEPEEEEE